MLLQIANESLLDVLKLLDYSNLCNIQLVNNRLFQFINRFRNELPLKEFSQIEIVNNFLKLLNINFRFQTLMLGFQNIEEL